MCSFLKIVFCSHFSSSENITPSTSRGTVADLIPSTPKGPVRLWVRGLLVSCLSPYTGHRHAVLESAWEHRVLFHVRGGVMCYKLSGNADVERVRVVSKGLVLSAHRRRKNRTIFIKLYKFKCKQKVQLNPLRRLRGYRISMRQPRIERGAHRWQRWILPLNH